MRRTRAALCASRRAGSASPWNNSKDARVWGTKYSAAAMGESLMSPFE